MDELKDAIKDVYTQNQILNSHNADLEKSIEKSSKELRQKEIEVSQTKSQLNNYIQLQ